MSKNNQKAVVKIGAHQYLVETGKQLLVDKISEKNIKDGKVAFKTVLASLGSADSITFGDPYTKDTVEASVLDREVKDKKITVVKYKPKTRYKRKQGHRQVYSKIKIDSVSS
jgi:large subunit ribosomal protein L21